MRKTFSYLLICIAAALSIPLINAASAAPIATVKPPPNIVLLLAADLGFSALASYGSEINTPNLSTLARQGVQFSNFHVAANCAPTRAMLMTGQHWMTLPSEKPQANWGSNQTLPALLKKSGNYQPFIIGKQFQIYCFLHLDKFIKSTYLIKKGL